MKQELREPIFCNSILESIATGATKLNQIATKVGESTAKVSRYLKILMDLSIVEKRTPYGLKKTSRKSIYRIADPLFDFWYRFVFPNATLLEQEMVDQVYTSILAPHLDAYVGKQFERVCLDYLLQLNKGSGLPALMHEFGSWWGGNPQLKREEEIDIVAGNQEMTLLAECK